MADDPRKPDEPACARCRNAKRGGTTVRPDEALGETLCGWCWVNSRPPEGRPKRP